MWQNDRDHLPATALTMSRQKKRNLGKVNYPAAPDGTRTRDLSITSPAIHHWAIPAPQFLFMLVKN